jgi:hypothetical protein
MAEQRSEKLSERNSLKRREIKRDKKFCKGLCGVPSPPKGKRQALRMTRDFDEVFSSQDAEALRNLIWRTHQTPANAMSKREQIDAAVDTHNHQSNLTNVLRSATMRFSVRNGSAGGLPFSQSPIQVAACLVTISVIRSLYA